MNNREDYLSLQSQEEKIKGNSSKSKRKKIAIATTASILAATAIVVPTALYVSRTAFDIGINTNIDVIEEYTINVKRGMFVKDIVVQEIYGYTFVGFYKDAELTIPYGENDRVSKKMQIYAKYEINTYSVKFPTSTYFTVEGEGIEDNQANIEYNTEYRFKINLNMGYGESEIIVKANGELMEPDSDGYYILTIKENVVIEVDGVETNTYTINEIPTQITIKRNDIILTTKDKVYYGDRLEIIYNETVGYKMTEFSVTGATREDETNFYTVTGDLTVIYEEDYIDYTIADIPTQITIKRNNIILTTEDVIHYGDVIEITYNVTEGYEFENLTVTGADQIDNTNQYTVTGNLTINYSEQIKTFEITIAVNNSEYGKLNTYSVTVPYRTTYTTSGNILTFSNDTEIIATASTNTAQYTYTFANWSSGSGIVTAEETITANFNRTTNSYTVTFYDENKTTILDTLKDEYGTSIVYSGEEPTKPADNTYTYTFECWETVDGEEYDLSGKTITSDLALYARYRATYIEYEIANIPAQVEIKKGEQVLTSEDTLHYGDEIEITYTVTPHYNMIEFEVVGASLLAIHANKYMVTDDLTVIYEEEIQTFDVTIGVNNAEYGSLNIYVVTVPYGTTYLTSDNTLTFGNNTDVIAKASMNTAQYTYTFTGWSSDSGTIIAETTITANFNRTTNSYTVTFYDENKTTVLDTLNEEYGTGVVYSGEEPTKLADNTYTYSFECWETSDGEEYDLSGKTITSDLALYARYRATYIEYEIANIPAQVEIKKGEQVLTSEDTLHYGDEIEITYTVTTGYNVTEFSVTGATKEGETNFYTVTGDLTVIYEEEIQTFDVTIEVNNVEYGSLNKYIVTMPYGTTYTTSDNILTFNDKTNIMAISSENTAQYTYTFANWSSNSGTITAEETITANFNRTTNSYTVTFYDEDRIVLDTLTDEYGTSIVYSGVNPTKSADNTYTYTFECWETVDGEEYDLSGKTITSDLALYARYRATYIEYEIANIPAQVEIKKGEQVLTSEDTLHYGDEIEITYTVTPHYNMIEFEVAGASLLAIHANKYMVTDDLTVIYEEEIQTFTVQWLNYDGEVLETDTVVYGSIPEYNGETPVRESTDDEYHYTFTGWSPNITAVTSLTSYVAQFRQDEILPFEIIDGMIASYTGKDTEVIVPSTYSITYDGTIIVGEDYEVIGIRYRAFQYNSNITSIIIPASVTSIGINAFYGCSNLNVVIFENPNGWWVQNNSNIIELNSTDIKNTETLITYLTSTYYNYKWYRTDTKIPFVITSDGMILRYTGTDTDVVIPSTYSISEDGEVIAGNDYSVTSIGEYAFYNCSSLTSITLPANINSIKTWAFDGCSNLANVYYEGTIDEWMEISFGSSGSNPLNNGANLYVNGDELVTEVNIDTATRINANVFNGCTSLTKVTIGSQVVFMDSSPFSGCDNLANVYYEGTIEEWMEISFSSSAGGPLSNGANLYVNGDELVTEINIDSATTIKDHVFVGCTSITKVTLGNQVTSIGGFAFRDCSNLATVIFEEGSQLESIETDAFDGCTGLTSITIPANVTSIGNGAFLRCSNLANVYYEGTIDEWLEISFGGYDSNPLCNGANLYVNGDELVTEVSIDTATRIKNYVFEGCGSLTKVTIGSQVTSIGEYAFYYCSNLATVIFEEGSQLESLGKRAFNGCTGLTSITIPASVTSIGEDAFSSCSNLATVIFEEGSQLESIGKQAFVNCSSLSSITIPASVTSIGNLAFGYTFDLETVIIESNYAYKTATSTTACGNLLQNATEVRVLTSCIGTDTNSYLENTANFTKTTDGEYTVYTKVQ